MGLIPRSFIDDLIARTDIVEVIGTRVQLKKAGREFRACCPFHNEKTPSFWVSPEKQFYHCFGCGAHGTVLRFLMEYDRMGFPEAVEELANRLGLEVPHEGGGGPAPPRRPDEPLYELMSRVAQFYMDSLARDERARTYAAQRGLDGQTLEQFAIGYAPSSWNQLLRRFGKSEAERRQLAEVGLIVERDRGPSGPALRQGQGESQRDNERESQRESQRENREGQDESPGERYYDRFRDRLMFPIRDVRGRIIAFGGRVIDRGEPKYLNSPETLLFHKGRELYGLYETRRARADLKRLLIVEGYMDAVRLHQHGLTYAVATLGTATTPEHFKRIFRLVSEVVFAFDGDRAGRAAAWRALQHALPEAREGREIRFLFLPEGHDPDTLVGAEGREAFEQRLQRDTVPLADYLVQGLSDQAELVRLGRAAGGRARFGELARPLLEKVPEGVYRRLLLEKIARVVSVAPEELQRAWDAEARSTAQVPVRREGPPRREPPARHPAANVRISAGRGTLVRQAVLCLLTFPEIAAQISEDERASLEALVEPGIGLLRELLDHLRAEPATVPGQIIERWQGRPGVEALERLLGAEQILESAAQALSELRGAVQKLAEMAALQRLETLELKSLTERLTPAELAEFQQLMRRRSPGRSS